MILGGMAYFTRATIVSGRVIVAMFPPWRMFGSFFGK